MTRATPTRIDVDSRRAANNEHADAQVASASSASTSVSQKAARQRCGASVTTTRHGDDESASGDVVNDKYNNKDKNGGDLTCSKLASCL